jgi:hypothetical protein|tara:strand:+ start:59 stop:472 length:414 start_codon:yes stop_codon:yes gene_type:complete
MSTNKNQYYYLVLPNLTLNNEAIEEVIREQESYNKKFQNRFNRCGYMINKFDQGNFPSELLTSIRNSSFYKLRKLKNFKNNYFNNNSNDFKDFNILITSNKEFVNWIALKLVEIENNANEKQIQKINYNGLQGSLSL